MTFAMDTGIVRPLLPGYGTFIADAVVRVPGLEIFPVRSDPTNWLDVIRTVRHRVEHEWLTPPILNTAAYMAEEAAELLARINRDARPMDLRQHDEKDSVAWELGQFMSMLGTLAMQCGTVPAYTGGTLYPTNDLLEAAIELNAQAGRVAAWVARCERGKFDREEIYFAFNHVFDAALHVAKLARVDPWQALDVWLQYVLSKVLPSAVR